MMLYLRSHQDNIRIWRIRRAHRLERETYVRAHKEELMEAMRHHQLTVYVDPELDTAHDNAEARYAQDGMSYLWHLERTDEQVQIEGHLFLFNKDFAERLIQAFCLPRWWLITQVCNEDCLALIFPYLSYVMQPYVDRETRPQQRAMIRVRDNVQGLQ